MNEIIAQIMADDSITDKVQAIAEAAAKENQREADKIRGKYSQENKTLQEKLKAKELESMTELEKKEALFNEERQEHQEAKKRWESDRLIKEKNDFFKEKGITLDVFDLVKGGNPEEWGKSYENINGIITKLAGSQVEERLKGAPGSPEDYKGNPGNPLTYETFKAMTPEERKTVPAEELKKILND